MKNKIVTIFCVSFALLMTGCSSGSQVDQVEQEESVELYDDGSDEDDSESYEEVSLSTLDEVQEAKSGFVKKYQDIFEKSEVPYEKAPNDAMILGTETKYSILDENYYISEMVGAAFYSDDEYNYIDYQVNIFFEYHEEKGLDKDNPHVKLIYNILHEAGNYDSIEEMISEMSEKNSESGVNGMYWEKQYDQFSPACKLKLAYHEMQKSSYEVQLCQSELSSLEERDDKLDSYKKVLEKNLSEKGYEDSTDIVYADLYDGTMGDLSYCSDSNNLGAELIFDGISTSQKNINKAVEIVKVYIDTANELFEVKGEISSDLLAKDIVSRAMLKNHSDNALICRYYHSIDMPDDMLNFACEDLIDWDFSHIYSIQYPNSVWYEALGDYYEGYEKEFTIRYYIPIKVDGVLNK